MNWISLNRETLEVLHKWSTPEPLGNLIHIEEPTTFCEVWQVDKVAHSLTLFEINRFYKNLFPDEHVPDCIETKKSRITAYLDEMELSDIDPDEVRRQALSIQNNDKKRYKYVKGSFCPARPASLFPQQAPVVPPPWKPAAPPSPPPVVRRGRGTRERVWEVADKMWEEAGKPTSSIELLSLRKRIMNFLDSEGVNRNSSSNMLGQWQKTKVTN